MSMITIGTSEPRTPEAAPEMTVRVLPQGAPSRRGNFTCRGGLCQPLDLYSIDLVRVINRYLGLHRDARYGIDALTVNAAQKRVLAGDLKIARPLGTPADLAASAVDLAHALLVRMPGMPPLGAAKAVEKKRKDNLSVVGDSMVQGLQEELQKAGKNIKADGRMGTETLNALNDILRAAGRPPASMDEVKTHLGEGVQWLRTYNKAHPTLTPEQRGREIAYQQYQISRDPKFADVSAEWQYIEAKRRVDAGARMPVEFPPNKATVGSKAAALQVVLRAAGAKIAQDGQLGPATLKAFNDLRRSSGEQEMTLPQLKANIDKAVEWVIARTVPAGRRLPPPTAQQAPTPMGKTPAQNPEQVAADFTCLKGICTGSTPAAKKKAVALQTLLNQFPAQIIETFDNGRKLVADGRIGAHTANAVIAVARASAIRQGKTLTKADLSITSAQVVQAIDDFTKAFTAELAIQIQRFGGEMPPDNAYTVGPKGAVVGNARFRCMVMGLQVQLNRFGQKLVIEGVLGPNTMGSFNRVMGTKLDALAIAANLDALVIKARQKADDAKVPVPPADAGGRAMTKCAMDFSQPTTDSRTSAAPANVTLPPAPTPTPTAHQPLPPHVETKAPNTDIHGRRKKRPGAKPKGATAPTPTSGQHDINVTTDEGEVSSPEGPEGAPAPEPPAPISEDEAAQLEDQAASAGLDAADAKQIVELGLKSGAPAEAVANALRAALQAKAGVPAGAASAITPPAPFPFKAVGIAIGVGLGVGGLALGLAMRRPRARQPHGAL